MCMSAEGTPSSVSENVRRCRSPPPPPNHQPLGSGWSCTNLEQPVGGLPPIFLLRGHEPGPRGACQPPPARMQFSPPCRGGRLQPGRLLSFATMRRQLRERRREVGVPNRLRTARRQIARELRRCVWRGSRSRTSWARGGCGETGQMGEVRGRVPLWRRGDASLRRRSQDASRTTQHKTDASASVSAPGLVSGVSWRLFVLQLLPERCAQRHFHRHAQRHRGLHRLDASSQPLGYPFPHL